MYVCLWLLRMRRLCLHRAVVDNDLLQGNFRPQAIVRPARTPLAWRGHPAAVWSKERRGAQTPAGNGPAFTLSGTVFNCSYGEDVRVCHGAMGGHRPVPR